MSDLELMKRGVAAIEGIRLVLGALHVSQLGDIDQGAKAARLDRCGFSNTEIANLLGITANNVRVLLHRTRKSQPKSKKILGKKSR